MKSIDLKISNRELHFKEGLKVNNKYSSEDKKKLEKVSKEFENILTSMMLKSMTKTTDGLFGKDNYGGDVLDVLFETEISKHITESQGMGVADQIYKSITGEALKNNKTITRDRLLDNPIPIQRDMNINSIKKNITRPSSNAMQRLEKYNSLIDEASNKFNVDKQLIKSVILTESAGKANAKSKANAKGLMQLMDSTATDMGVRNPWNPKDNIYGGTKYLSKLLKDFDGDLDLALAAYNAGPGNVKKYNGIPPFKETQNYIKRVNNYLNILE
jgi:Rod binding domain-containing protein